MTLSVPIDPATDRVPSEAFHIHKDTVRPEWIDYNGHMNVAYYVLAFDHATDRFLDLLDLGVSYMERTNNTTFVLETHVTYAQEVQRDDPLRFTVQLLDADEKRLHYFIEMFHAEEGFLSATSEQIAMHIDLDTRRAAAFGDTTVTRIAMVREAQKNLPRPPAAGRVIGIRRKSAA